MDLAVIVEAFVIVVVGGMGSVTGALLASLLIGVLQAFGLVLIPKATLVLIFVIMAVVLTLRPAGLMGRPATTEAPIRRRPPAPLPPAIAGWLCLGALISAPFWLPPYPLSVLTEILVACTFAASLHLLMGPGGMVSFGHAAWFAIGAYAAALAGKAIAMPAGLVLAPLTAGVAAFLFGGFVARLSGVYLAMLTLAFAQIVWAVATQFAWLTGGDDGILGLWPTGPLAFYWWVLVLSALTIWLLFRVADSPFGLALRAARDSESRARTVGLRPEQLRAAAFTLSGAAAGLAGGLSAFRTGSVFPDVASVGRSVDALVMVLLGGVDAAAGPVLGATVYTGLYDWLLQVMPLWRLALGFVILALVLLFPTGLGAPRRAS
jgi:branched-chain amino acid transport system permease protein